MQGIRFATAILALLSKTLANTKSLVLLTVLLDILPSIADSWGYLVEIHKRWQFAKGDTPSAILRYVTDMRPTISGIKGAESILRGKIDDLTILLCCQVLEERTSLLSHGIDGATTRQTLCMSAINLAGSAARTEPVRRHVKSQLLNTMAKLVKESPVLEEGTDFAVGVPVDVSGSSLTIKPEMFMAPTTSG
jgi:hypothetical protein